MHQGSPSFEVPELPFSTGSDLNLSENEFKYDDKSLKCKERNREHAKKTRLRKKAHLDILKARLVELQQEATRLQTEFEENNTANILLCLSVRLNPANLDDLIPRPSSSMNSAVVKGDIISHLRNSVRVEAAKRKSSLLLQNPVSAALSVRAAAAVTAAAAGLPPPPPSQAYNPTTFAYASAAPPMIDTRPIDHTMWQSRMANPSTASISPVGHDDSSMEEMDEDSVSPSQDDKTSGDFKTMDLLEQTVTNEELFAIRKERNRQHARMTRDRKKMFISKIQEMIHTLERQNASLRVRLQSVTQLSNAIVLPSTHIPQPSPSPAPVPGGEELASAASTVMTRSLDPRPAGSIPVPVPSPLAYSRSSRPHSSSLSYFPGQAATSMSMPMPMPLPLSTPSSFQSTVSMLDKDGIFSSLSSSSNFSFPDDPEFLPRPLPPFGLDLPDLVPVTVKMESHSSSSCVSPLSFAPLPLPLSTHAPAPAPTPMSIPIPFPSKCPQPTLSKWM